MVEEMKRMVFSTAMSKTFRKDGQSLAEFAAEMRQLNDVDRKWYCAELRKTGIDCEDPQPVITKQ